MIGKINIQIREIDMKNIFKAYNNEAFICCVIQSLLIKTNNLDISRLFVFIAILLQDKVIDDSKFKSYECIIHYVKDNPKKFIRFNKIFEALLPLTLNSLTLMSEASEIEINNQDIILSRYSLSDVSGIRLNKIRGILPHFITMSNDIQTKQLLVTLKIEI